MDKKKYLVTAAPPTSNGNLHIGHLAGPFLGADVFSRIQRMLENDVLYISYGDDYQDYVERKALETNKTPEDISTFYTNEMKETLRIAHMLPDHFPGSKNIPMHPQIMQEIFLDLYKNNQIQFMNVTTFYCEKCEKFEYEAYARGNCHYCGSSSDANYCESCGQPQEAGMLLNATCHTCKNELSLYIEDRAYFPLSKHKDILEKYYENKNWRPDAKELCKKILDNEIDAPVTRNSNWGIKVPLENREKHILDTWYGGPAGYISATMDWSSLQSDKDTWKEYWQSEDTKWIAFVGYDCTFSHGVFYPAMLKAHGKYNAPDTVVTNKFYGLDGEKISTSRNHAIWGNDIFNLVDSDAVRLYLSSTAPESTEMNFNLDDFQKFVNEDLAESWNKWLLSLFNEAAALGITSIESILKNPTTKLEKKAIKCLEQIQVYYDAENFSLQKITSLILELAKEAMDSYWRFDRTVHESNLAMIKENLRVVRLLAVIASPIMTEFSIKVMDILGEKNTEDKKIYLWTDLKNKTQILPKKPLEPFFAKVPQDVFEKLSSYKKEVVK